MTTNEVISITGSTVGQLVSAGFAATYNYDAAAAAIALCIAHVLSRLTFLKD